MGEKFAYSKRDWKPVIETGKQTFLMDCERRRFHRRARRERS